MPLDLESRAVESNLPTTNCATTISPDSNETVRSIREKDIAPIDLVCPPGGKEPHSSLVLAAELDERFVSGWPAADIRCSLGPGRKAT